MLSVLALCLLAGCTTSANSPSAEEIANEVMKKQEIQKIKDRMLELDALQERHRADYQVITNWDPSEKEINKLRRKQITYDELLQHHFRNIYEKWGVSNEDEFLDIPIKLNDEWTNLDRQLQYLLGNDSPIDEVTQ